MLNQNKFWNTIEKQEDCWTWTGSSASGYGNLGVDYKTVLAHRLAYELIKGKIPEGLVIDHLCKNRLCINPEHLEAVTQRENVIRSKTVECKYGHYNWKFTGKQRQCKTCTNLRMRKYRAEGKYE